VEDLQNQMRIVQASAEAAQARADESLEQAAFLGGTVEDLRVALARAEEELREQRHDVVALQARGGVPAGVVASAPAVAPAAGAPLARSRAQEMVADMRRRLEVACRGFMLPRSVVLTTPLLPWCGRRSPRSSCPRARGSTTASPFKNIFYYTRPLLVMPCHKTRPPASVCRRNLTCQIFYVIQCC
jgi:hypothetical protein